MAQPDLKISILWADLVKLVLHDFFDIPTPPRRQRAQLRGDTGRRRARSAPAFGAERVARDSDPAATGARARSAHAIGAKRVTRGDAVAAAVRCCALWLPHCPTRTRARWEAPAF